MGIDPELKERLEDLRNGYGDVTPVEASLTERSVRARRSDWEIRTGTGDRPRQDD